ncbi:zingipain-2 [Drosophila grimshawi]|uniref:GH20868 n=1 Tax=Drosophila grimshawi TaxID=7222 RepID=B4J587_DROGR|nr:zingipain-2 [Drosophila grimshawi]EDW00713.1 GH20868 [Drosophila grimshawi]
MLKLLLCCALFAGGYAFNHGQAQLDFEAYMRDFHKEYANSAEQNNAQYYYNYHKNLITQHEALANRNASSYHVKLNQFSDIRLKTFAARLPQSVYPSNSFHTMMPVPPMDQAPPQFDMLANTMTLTAQDQGTVCSSSWAYSLAKSVQIMNALQTSNMKPLNISAQSLIDCAGMGTGCTTQVPQIGFDYLTQNPGTSLVTETEYPPNNSINHEGMCLPTMTASNIVVESYGIIADSNDNLLMRYVASGFPVIVEYNPATFGFMHYSSGVYVPPVHAQASSSQFLVILGYGHDTQSNLNYWRAVNSFGSTWGEDGFIKIVRSPTQPIAKRAIFPNTLI